MADDPTKQPLISKLSSDPPLQPQGKNNTKKRRFRRCKSTPFVDVLSNRETTGSPFPSHKIIFRNLSTPSFKHVVFFVVSYLALGSMCFYLVRNQVEGKKTNAFLDALYFVIVTMTTVGYGDLVPNSAATKLLACAFVISGMAIVGLLLTRAADYLVDKQEVLLVKALHLRNKQSEVQMMREIGANRAKYKFITTALSLVFLIAIGTIFLMKVEKLGFVDAFYCVCSTMTTLGYGDKSFSTEWGRVFAVFWILASTILLAQFFLYLAEFYTEHKQRKLANWVLNRRMTFGDLEAADLDEDGVVGASEFIIYKLKELGKINQEDIALIMEEFEDLDIDQSGAISATDVVLGQSD